MKSSTKLSLAMALALGSAPAFALQLGEIRVKSALDEPLVAEIPIQLDNLSEANNLRAGLASQADFDKAGIPRTGLDPLRFSIVTDTTGHKLVLITSQQPIADPYLDFLVEVDNASGKQLREYTVLLDPVIGAPPTEQEIAATVMAQQQQATPAPTSAPATPSASAAAPAPERSQPGAPSAPPQPVRSQPTAPARPASRSDEYTVQSGDTLYHIASENRPDDETSVDQMMLALQSNNPDAFYHDNINNLKSGAILRIPSRDEIAAAPAGSKARAQVHRQIEDWRGVAARKATVVASAAAAAQGAAPSNASGGEDKLALVPPTQGGGSAATRAGEKGGTGSDEVAGLKQQLATAKESLASLKQESSELQSRLKDLEDIGGKSQKLLAMKDAQIAELQAKLAKLQAASGVAASASAAVPAAAGTTATQAAATPAPASTAVAKSPAAGSVAAPMAATTAAAVAPQVAAKTAPAARPAATKPHAASSATGSTAMEVLPWYQRPLAWIAAGIVLLALILVGLLRRRPKPLPELPEESGAPSLADHFGDSPMPPEPQHEAPADAEESAHAAATTATAETAAPAAQDYDFTFDEPPPGEPVAEPGMPAPDLPVPEVSIQEPSIQAPPVPDSDDLVQEHDADADAAAAAGAGAAEVAASGEGAASGQADEEFSDDPVDTKLDLARAYLDMGDPAGARAMLEEVLNEGSQTQKDEARRLLDDMA